VTPGDEARWLSAADRLLAGEALRARMGAAGRAHAEKAFHIEDIAWHFEAILA